MRNLLLKTKKGFTLIELIIVIAIIGILAAILIPNFTGMVKESQGQACADYRKAVLAEYVAKTVGDSTYELSSFLKDDEITCPYGGEYTAISATNGKSGIACSIHADSTEVDPGGDSFLPSTLYDQMVDLHALYESLSDKEKHELAGWGSNDELRAALSKKYYDGAWPQFPQALLDKYGIKPGEGKTLYIQPYLNKQDGSNQVVIFAQTSLGGNWYTNLVYDHEQGIWYRALKNNSISVTKSWPDIKNLIHDSSKWEPLK